MVAALADRHRLLSVLTGPSANAGELRDRQRAVKKIAHADHELEESSARLRRATQALSHAREQLTEARAELGDVRARLALAQQRDEEMRAALSAAEARLEQARDDVAMGKDALKTQREVVVDTITSLYEQGDPDLLAFTSLLNSQTPANITRQREANRSVVQRQGDGFDDLRAAEVLLEVHENEVEEAAARGRREAAGGCRPPRPDAGADPGGAGRQGTRQESGRRPQGRRGDGLQGQDEGPQGPAQAEEAGSQIQKLIQEAIRKARERARRKAAARRGEGRRGRPADRRQRPADAAGQQPGHLALRLPRSPDLRVLRPARRHRLRCPLQVLPCSRPGVARCSPSTTPRSGATASTSTSAW